MIILDDWQKEIMDYDGDILLCTGRRGGKTYVFCRKAIELMINKPKIRIGLSSLTEDQAIFIIETMKQIAFELCPHLISLEGKVKATLKTLPFTNGSIAFSRPVGNAGDSWRGYELDILYVDEASRMPKYFWSSAKPTIMTTGGKIWMSSTPAGKKGYFWDKFEEVIIKKNPEARFKVVYKSAEDIIKDRPVSESWTEKIRKEALRVLEEDKREMTKIEYGQEYLGQFLDDLNQFYETSLIEKCQNIDREEQATGNIYFIGVDLARYGGDLIVYSIFKIKGDDIIQVDSIEKKDQPLNVTEEDIIRLDKIWNPIKIGIDSGSGSMGVSVFDHLIVHDTLKYKVEAMNNRAISLNRDGSGRQKLYKEDMHNGLKALMEQGKVRLLRDENIKASFESVQSETNEKTQNLTIFGNYTHHVESIMRAVDLASKTKVNKLFISYF